MNTHFLQGLPHNMAIETSETTSVFKSFWMGGYECADHLNAFGERVDFLKITGHIQNVEEDYKLLGQLKIKTVREGIRWSQVEKHPYIYDWSSVALLISAGKKYDIQQLWDLCHFGFPNDLTPLHPMFAHRFASLCAGFVSFYRSLQPYGELIITPINEVGFLSWLGGDVKGTSPYCTHQGWEVKYNLMKAYIEGIEALKAKDPGIKILVTEPLINIVAQNPFNYEEQEMSCAVNENQFQVIDILTGAMCPELRGKAEYIDIIGYNYYHNNQWVLGLNETVDWKKNNDFRYKPLHKLLIEASTRYEYDIIIAETSHTKEDRAEWMDMIVNECSIALLNNVPLKGICWYPLLNRPDWDHLTDWHYSGIWDDIYTKGNKERILSAATAQAFCNAQEQLNLAAIY